MTRLVTAPCLGALVGALEGGIVFIILTVIDVRQGGSAGVDNETIYQAATYGIIFGGFVGAVIGLIVGLGDMRGRGGLLIGSLTGVVCSIYVLKDTGPYDLFWRVLAVIVLPAAASMGLLSAVLTARRKEPQPSSESHKSHRIIS